MRRLHLRSIGLLGQVFLILLVTITVEFGASTLLYESASRFSVREDEARRLAEHLVIARRLMAEAPARERGDLSRQLTTDRYVVRWSALMPPSPPLAPALDEIRRQVLTWEPSLARAGLNVRLTSPGRHGVAVGSLRLPDGSWLRFSTREHIVSWNLAINRVVLALVPAIALIVMGGLSLRRMLDPLRALAQAADRIGHGGPGGAVLEETGPSEVRRVISAFNDMQARIHRLIEERTEALAAVGHDLRTPIARLQLRLDAVKDETARAALAGDLAEMSAMLASLLDYLAGDDDPDPVARIDLAVLLAMLADDAQDRGFPATYEGPDHLELPARPSGLKRALTNLVENALHYSGGVELSLAEQPGGVLLLVEDRGPGIPEEQLAEVLRPFARLDQARARNTSGLGLGLAIVCRFVEREGAGFRLSNRAGGGLSAAITLPPRSALT